MNSIAIGFLISIIVISILVCVAELDREQSLRRLQKRFSMKKTKDGKKL